MSELKLSDVLEDLKKVAEIGALFYRDVVTERIVVLCDTADQRLDIAWARDELDRVTLDRQDQALIIDALEQYALYAVPSAYYFDFATINSNFSKATLWKFTGETFTAVEATTYVEPTRLQAALKAFITVFGGDE